MKVLIFKPGDKCVTNVATFGAGMLTALFRRNAQADYTLATFIITIVLFFCYCVFLLLSSTHQDRKMRMARKRKQSRMVSSMVRLNDSASSEFCVVISVKE